MPLAKPFIANAIEHKALVLGYLRFPEITEVFQNICKNRDLSHCVLSDWDTETLDGHIKEFIIPMLLDNGVISKNNDRKSFYSSEYIEIQFEGLTRSQLAMVAAKRATLISQTVETTDTRYDMLSANLHFHALPDSMRTELLGSLRNILSNFISNVPDDAKNGRQFRLAMVARAEK